MLFRSVRTNLALTQVQRREWRVALPAVESVLRDADQHDLRPLTCPLLLALSTCAAATGDVAYATWAFAEARRRLKETGFVDVDNEALAWLLEEVATGELAADARAVAEAQRATRLGRK